ncbi:hypothetical protein OQA88_9340 [Cercophora sp. LCS_1]
MKGRYVALSHCRGGSISPVLDETTLERFQQDIPVSSLPANFIDAIIITRQPSIEYLWIDSLCTLQGSTEDWEAESAVMADVYLNSLVTISALSSPHSRAGILSQRQTGGSDSAGHPSTGEAKPATSWTSISKTSPASTVTVQAPQKFQSLHNMFPDQVEPLLQRGWALQESLLPSRQLFYSSEQIH